MSSKSPKSFQLQKKKKKNYCHRDNLCVERLLLIKFPRTFKSNGGAQGDRVVFFTLYVTGWLIGTSCSMLPRQRTLHLSIKGKQIPNENWQWRTIENLFFHEKRFIFDLLPIRDFRCSRWVEHDKKISTVKIKVETNFAASSLFFNRLPNRFTRVESGCARRDKWFPFTVITKNHAKLHDRVLVWIETWYSLCMQFLLTVTSYSATRNYLRSNSDFVRFVSYSSTLKCNLWKNICKRLIHIIGKRSVGFM